MTAKSSFDVLNAINVSHDIASKNGFSYLSWASAWVYLKKNFPEAKIGINKFDGLPFLKTENGCYVEAYCTIGELTETELMPVLDFKNQPIKNPNAFDVNKSIKRAMVKAMALHGLGLYIYEGEDLPSDEREAIENAKAQLRELLKLHKVYEKSFEAKLSKMSYNDLITKINEYSDKEK